MKYEKPTVEVVKFNHDGFMTASGESTGWNASQGVNKNNVYDFLATVGVYPSDIMGGGVDALQINQSTHTVICNTNAKCYGKTYNW